MFRNFILKSQASVCHGDSFCGLGGAFPLLICCAMRGWSSWMLQDHRCSTMKWDRDPPGKTTMILLELPRSHPPGTQNWSHFLAQHKNGWWTLQSMMLNMPGRRCRWCSNPDKIYISRFVFLKQRVGQMGETSLDFPIFSSFFLAGQDMVPNSVRLKDEKPLLDSHIFGSAKLEAK